MIRTESISLARVPFVIEEDAYGMLCGYLSDLQNHYRDKESGGEIVDAIEERMAELFKEKTASGRVITLGVVSQVISQLGTADEMDSVSQEKALASSGAVSKRLYKDRRYKVISGVCAGLGAYFNIDTVWVRLIFAVLFLVGGFFTDGFLPGIIILVYVLLAVSMPSAVTVEQRCRMHGRDVGISDIESKIRYGNAARTSRGTGLSKVMTRVFGAVFILMGVCGLLFGSLTTLWVRILEDHMIRYSVQISSLSANIFFMTLLHTVMILPAVMLLYEGILLAFGFTAPKFRPGLIALVLWIFSLIALMAWLAVVAYEMNVWM